MTTRVKGIIGDKATITFTKADEMVNVEGFEFEIIGETSQHEMLGAVVVMLQATLRNIMQTTPSETLVITGDTRLDYSPEDGWSDRNAAPVTPWTPSPTWKHRPELNDLHINTFRYDDTRWCVGCQHPTLGHMSCLGTDESDALDNLAQMIREGRNVQR